MNETIQPRLMLKNLKTYYPIRSGVFSRIAGQVKAVDDVSLRVYPWETLGLVGESGCGKSSLARTVIGLETLTSGQVFFDGENISAYSRARMRSVRPRLQMVFQDPYAALNPRRTAESMMAEILHIHRVVARNRIAEEIDRLLALIGLPPEAKRRFPHEFSGGQRQRLSIALAITARPRFLICDEATSALDVSVQAQILELFKDLRQRLGLSYLFISHNLGAVRCISDRVAVMYLGKILEIAPRRDIFAAPRHPYTQALLHACLKADPRQRGRRRPLLSGAPPSAANPPAGCRFHPRCPFREAECSVREAALRGDGEHQSACHFSIGLADWTGVQP
jgi:peptide/nickel transport system ATP-binding protein/oligopeptide transport system ATP-binding protein